MRKQAEVEIRMLNATLEQRVELRTNQLQAANEELEAFTYTVANEEDRTIRNWVADNGIAIAPEHQKRIFRVFERLHGIESYPGIGRGLAIVEKAVDRMGGQVGVESQLGQGSRF